MALEDGPVMPPRLLRHLEPEPVCPQNVDHPGAHFIPFQDIKTSNSAQCIVGLAQVEEDETKDHLPHSDELLKNLCLEGGGPHSSPRAKSMQSVMDLDGRQYPAVDDAGYIHPTTEIGRASWDVS